MPDKQVRTYYENNRAYEDKGKQMTTGKLLVISGPSGTGKGTICKKLFEDFENIVFSVSMTTRNPREGEIHGQSYYFTEKSNFEKMISEDGFLEYAKVFDNYYGTPKKPVIDQLSKGNDVLLEIDVQGAMQVRDAYPEAVLIFILPTSLKELKNRIINRGSESEESLNKRLGEAMHEITYADKYDYAVINDDLDEAVKQVESIIVAEHLKVTQNIAKVIDSYRKEI